MKSKKTPKSFVFGILVVFTIIVFIILIGMWMNLGTFSNNKGEILKSTLTYKIIITFGILIFLSVEYLFFNHQKNLDKKEKLNTQKT